jgi:FkbM family methyltransferase
VNKVPFGFVCPTIYGPMILNRHDINQTGALLRTGRAIDHDEIDMLRQVLGLLEGPHNVIDIGANFGVYSIALADLAAKVHAFEPQRIVCNMLAGSIALNGLDNVFAHNVALGNREDSIELPQYDYNAPLNFGSIEFGGAQTEALSQERGADPARVEYVRLAKLDSFGFSNVTMMKIDAEGMELAVLEGASETIAANRPVMYIEFVKSDRDALEAKVQSLGYDIHVNGMNFLCIPYELATKIPLTRRAL